MKFFIDTDGVRLHVDPNNYYTHVDPQQILNSLGLIPRWVIDGVAADANLKEFVCQCYTFPVAEMTGSTIDPKTFVMNYPGDEPLHPLVKIEANDQVFTQYVNGIVAFHDKADDSFFVTRMD